MFTPPLNKTPLLLLFILLLQSGMLYAQASSTAGSKAADPVMRTVDSAAAATSEDTDDAADATALPEQSQSDADAAGNTPAAVSTASVQDDSASAVSVVQQDLPALTLVAQPIYPQDLATGVYTPLVEYLAEGLGRDIELITPMNFQSHWSAVKAGIRHDLALEEAPLTDYRIHYQQYQPLVQAATAQSYSLAVLDNSFVDRFDLVGHPVATLPAPSSAYLFMTRWYDNPLSQPVIISTATSYDDAVQQLWGGEVEGVVLPSALATDYPQFTFIASSESMPGLALTAAPELDQATVAGLTELLLALNQEQFISVLDELNVDELVAADAADYRGYAEWIRSVSYTGFD